MVLPPHGLTPAELAAWLARLDRRAWLCLRDSRHTYPGLARCWRCGGDLPSEGRHWCPSTDGRPGVGPAVPNLLPLGSLTDD